MTHVASARQQAESSKDPAMVADRSPHRQRRRKLLVLALPIILLVGFVLAGDQMATAAADHLAGSTLGHCARLRGASVSFGSWPRLLGAATGQARDLRVQAKELDVGDFQIHNFRATADQATFSQLGLLTGSPRVDIKRGVATITTTAEDLTAYLQRKGVPGTVQASPGGITLSGAALGLLSWSLPLVFSAQNGALVVTPSFGTGLVPALVSGLVRQLIAIRGVRVSSVNEVPDGLQVVIAFSGNPADLACSAQGAVG